MTKKQKKILIACALIIAAAMAGACETIRSVDGLLQILQGPEPGPAFGEKQEQGDPVKGGEAVVVDDLDPLPGRAASPTPTDEQVIKDLLQTQFILREILRENNCYAEGTCSDGHREAEIQGIIEQILTPVEIETLY